MRDREELVNVRCCDLEVDLGRIRVIRNVSFDCCKGEWTVLTGPSGSGKTTLLRAINGLCPPAAGSIWALGSAIPGRRRREAQRVWRQTGTVMQDLGLFETRTAASNVELGLRAAGHDRGSAGRAARQWLDRFGLDDVHDVHPGRLSGGQRQRVALARAIAPAPQLLILDEPTAHLDDRSAKIVLAAIRELVEQGATVVMSSHRPEEVEDMTSCHIAIEAGQVREIRR